MASSGQSITISYVAWNTSTNAGQTGDVANHTLRWVKDGTSAAPTNAAAEVDSVNAPGVYKLTLTTAEATCNSGILCGKSSTANVAIMPISITFEQLPTAAPGANTGLPIVGTQVPNATAGASGGLPTLDASLHVAADAKAINAVATTSVTTINANIGTTQPVNFTGTGPSALTKSDTIDWASVAVVSGAVPAAVAGAAGGLLIAGSNAATTFTGSAASGATPATAGLTLVGGAASITSGGVAAPGLSVTGGAGAASTNGSAAGFTATAGGTTTVAGNDGAVFTGTGNGNGATYAHAGTGRDINGFAGLDWAHINAPTTTVNLSGTTISTSQAIASVSGSVGSVTGSVGSVVGAVGSVTGAVGSVTGNVGGSVVGDVQGKVLGGGASVLSGVGVQADLQTIKTQTVACAGAVTVLASVGTAATSTAQTGDAFARLGAPAGASIAADIAAGSPTTAIAETTSALNAAMSEIQLLYEIRSLLGADSVSVGTLSTKTVAGAAKATYTLTLDVNGNPTGITRAT